MHALDKKSLHLQPVNERLRLLGGTAKVALDLLEFDSKLERAFITICGCGLITKAVGFSLSQSLGLVANPSSCTT